MISVRLKHLNDIFKNTNCLSSTEIKLSKSKLQFRANPVYPTMLLVPEFRCSFIASQNPENNYSGEMFSYSGLVYKVCPRFICNQIRFHKTSLS